MYFSNVYSFPPKTLTLATSIQEYYLEFWFMLDNINVATFNSNLYYFFGVPHILLRSIADSLFKYANTQIGSGNTLYTISDINTYQWNQIIIQNNINSNNLWDILVYVNGNFIPSVTLTSQPRTYNMNLLGFLFCNSPIAPSTCKVNSVSYNTNWGNAFYKNIRIWDYYQSTLYTIQSFGKIYSGNLSSLYYNWMFTIDTINLNQITESLNPSANFFIANWQFKNQYDYNYRFNYAVNFDYVQNNPTSFIVLNSGTCKNIVLISLHNFSL